MSQKYQISEESNLTQSAELHGKEKKYSSFARRFNNALDHAGVPRGRSRIPSLSQRYQVTYEAARKWLSGESIPQTSRLAAIAEDYGMSLAYLLGRDEGKQKEFSPGAARMAEFYDSTSDSGRRALDAIRRALKAHD